MYDSCKGRLKNVVTLILPCICSTLSHQFPNFSGDEDEKNFKDITEAVGSKVDVRVSVVSQESESKDYDSEESSINCEKFVTRENMKRKTERK